MDHLELKIAEYLRGNIEEQIKSSALAGFAFTSSAAAPGRRLSFGCLAKHAREFRKSKTLIAIVCRPDAQHQVEQAVRSEFSGVLAWAAPEVLRKEAQKEFARAFYDRPALKEYIKP